MANYHAPDEKNVEKSVRTLNNFGVSNIRLQKDVFDADLYFKLLMLAKMGDLGRMTQYKSAPEETRTAQLLTYPVLMAHDVAGYDEVLVGEDQEQHLQYAGKLLRKYNATFSVVKVPKASLVGGRVKDLKDPTKKMSKSSPMGCIFLDDSPDDLRKKLRKATATPDGLENLGCLYRQFIGPDVPDSNEKLKTDLAEVLVEKFGKFETEVG